MPNPRNTISAGEAVVNTATFYYSDLVPPKYSSATVIFHYADVVVDKSFSNPETYTDLEYTYTLTVSNLGDLEGVISQISDTLPKGFNLIPSPISITKNGVSYLDFEYAVDALNTLTISGQTDQIKILPSDIYVINIKGIFI